MRIRQVVADTRAWVLVSALAVGGCGADPSNGSAPAVADVTIGSENALSVVASIWMGQRATDASDIVPGEVAAVRDHQFGYLSYRPNGGDVEVPCALGGRVRLEGSIADPAHAGGIAGDTLRARYEACETTLAGTLTGTTDGSLTVVVDSVDAAGTTIEASFDGLSTRIGSFGVFVREGDATIVAGSDGRSVTMRSDRLVVMEGTVVHALEGYEIRLVDEGLGVTDPYTLEFHGVESSASVGGRVTFTTPVPFEGLGDSSPTVGELLVEGAEGTSARLVAEPDGVHASLVLADGTTLPTTWAALEE